MTTENPEFQMQEAVSVEQIPEPIQNREITVGLKSPEPFKRFLNAVGTLVDEVTLSFDQEAMTVRSMDPSHIALIDVYWPSSGFERFENTNAVAVNVAVRVDELANILKDFDNKKDSLRITANGEDFGMLVLNNGNGTVVKARTIEASVSSTPLPKLNFNSAVRMDYAVFDKVLKAIQKVSEYISISTVNGKITFEGRGDSGEIAKVLEAGAEGLEELTVREDSKAVFSLDYISKIHRALRTSGKYELLMEYSSKMPIRLEYRISQVARVHFYLAPRVQD